MRVIYLNDCYEKEEAMMRAYGIPCARVSYPFQEGVAEIQGSPIFRGPKMKVAAYSEFIQDLEKIDCSALVGLNDFIKISDAIEYTRCFGSIGDHPRAVPISHAGTGNCCTPSDPGSQTG